MNIQNENKVDFSLDKMASFLSFSNLFNAMRKTWEKEQKDMVFERKTRQEEKEYFDIIKFFFSPPDIA